MTLRIAPEVVIETIDDDVLALDGNSQTVHRFTGSHATALTLITAGEPTNGFDAEIEELTQLGLLTTNEGLSRRSVLLGGSVLAGSTAVALSMPVAAMAQSELPFFAQTIGNRVFSFQGSEDDLFEVFLDADAGPEPNHPDVFDGFFQENQTWVLEIFSADPPGTFSPPLVLSGTTSLGDAGNLQLVFASDKEIQELGIDISDDNTVLKARLIRNGFQTNLFDIRYLD
jgi:hypothetical protein